MNGINQKFVVYLFAFSLLLFTTHLRANDNVAWQKTYPAPSEESFFNYAFSITKTIDNGFVIAGYTYTSAFNPDYFLIKIDKDGQIIWTKTFGSIGKDFARIVLQTQDGGFIVGGNTFGQYGKSNIQLFKLDSLGRIEWSKTYYRGMYNRIYSMKITSSGNIIIAGETSFSDSTNYDVLIIKTDAKGDTLWTRTYNLEDWDRAYSVDETSDGGFIFAGSAINSQDSGSVLFLLRTDSNGNTLWIKRYGGNGRYVGRSVLRTYDNGFIVTGYVEYSSHNSDIVIIKTDENGDTVWSKIVGGNNEDKGFTINQTPDSGYLIGGISNSQAYMLKINRNGDTIWTSRYTTGINNVITSVVIDSDTFCATGYTKLPDGKTKIYFLKTDSNGVLIYENTFAGIYTPATYAYSVQMTYDNGFILAGNIQYTTVYNPQDIYLIKTDSLGNVLWTQTYGDTGIQGAYKVLQTTDSGFIVVGYTKVNTDTDMDVYILKTDKNGSVIWTKTYGGNSEDVARSIVSTPDGGFIIVGETNSYGNGNLDVYAIKIDQNGDTLWTKTYGGSGVDVATSIVQTSSIFYIAGYTTSFGAGDFDMYVLKIDSVGNILWDKVYGTDGNEKAYSLTPYNNELYVVGETRGVHDTTSNVYIVKINQYGNVLWANSYGGSEDEVAFAAETRTWDGAVVVAGKIDWRHIQNTEEHDAFVLLVDRYGYASFYSSVYGGTEEDVFYSIKLLHTSSMSFDIIMAGYTKSFGSHIPEAYLVSSFFVNVKETSHETKRIQVNSCSTVVSKWLRVIYTLTENTRLKITIYNAAGRKIMETISNTQNKGKHIIRLNTKSLQKGLYFLKLDTPEAHTILRFIKID